MTPIAVYVHVPFCPSKCGYCDFNSYALSGEIVERTVSAIEAEIKRSDLAGRPAKTIFFGGGTPTFIPSKSLTRLLQTVVEVHPPIENCEITSEANPGTVDASKFSEMVAAGFNRLSMGVQSFEASDLVRLGRVHTGAEAISAFESARAAGFQNINLDLMFALPTQTLARWESNLERVLALQTEHLSLYCLTIEPGTSFKKQFDRGILIQPGENAQLEMYDLCESMLEAHGYHHYEISNFAKPGKECKHNLEYWRANEYAAYGPGAVSRVGCVRKMRWKQPAKYCTASETESDLFQEVEILNQEEMRTERIMLGLRLAEGVPIEEFDANAVRRLEEANLVESTKGHVVLTRQGRHASNHVIVELL